MPDFSTCNQYVQHPVNKRKTSLQSFAQGNSIIVFELYNTVFYHRKKKKRLPETITCCSVLLLTAPLT